MKKKRIIGIVLALCLLLVFASPALAAEPTINTVTLNGGVQGNTYDATHGGGPIVITGTYLTGTTVVSFGAGITVNSFNVDTDSQISASITIATGAAPGTRDVSVTTPEGTATKTAGFTVIAATWTLAAPAGFSLGAMSRTVANNKHGPNGLVTTNAQKWQVQVTGVASHGGFMWNGSASPTLVFQIGKNGTNWTDASGILTYGQPEPKAFPFWAQQTIDGDDPPGTYSITITFTGSPQ